MKNVLWLLCGIYLMIFLAACTHSSGIKEAFFSGMYHGANQIQETQALDDPPVVAHTPLSYEAYLRERHTIVSGRKDKCPWYFYLRD